MLIVRKKQCDAFKNARSVDFREKIVAGLNKAYPDGFNLINDTEKMKWVEEQEKYLLENGVFSKEHIKKALFAITNFFPIVPGSIEEKRICDIIEDNYKSSSEKVGALINVRSRDDS